MVLLYKSRAQNWLQQLPRLVPRTPDDWRWRNLAKTKLIDDTPDFLNVFAPALLCRLPTHWLPELRICIQYEVIRVSGSTDVFVWALPSLDPFTSHVDKLLYKICNLVYGLSSPIFNAMATGNICHIQVKQASLFTYLGGVKKTWYN